MLSKSSTLTKMRRLRSMQRDEPVQVTRKDDGQKCSLRVVYMLLIRTEALLLLDQIKREKGVWWMPWQQEAMKDVILCDKSWGAENKL